jgi:hypothetical protein
MQHDLARLLQDERRRELADICYWQAQSDRRRPQSQSGLRRLAHTIVGRRHSYRADVRAVPSVVIRHAEAGDLPALQRLAELEETAPPVGPTLIAVVDDKVEAALPLQGGPAIANPFSSSADLTELLRLRAVQLAA